MASALTLSGSIRTGSFNRKLAAHVGAKLTAAGVAVIALDLADFDLPLFNQDLEPDHVPEAAERLADLFRSHDMIFIATPEYNGSLPPVLVNAITWLSRQRPSPFRTAVFGIGGVSAGKYGTVSAQSHLRDSLSKLGALVVPTLLGIGPAASALDDEGVPVEREIIIKVDRIVSEMMHFSRGGV